MMHYNGIGNDVLVVGVGEKMLKASIRTRFGTMFWEWEVLRKV